MPATPIVYRLAGPVVARLVGLALVVVALLLLAGTAVVALVGLPADPLLAAAAGLVALVGVLAWWLRARAWVLRCTEAGYRVGLIRATGRARWRDVEDAVTVTRRGAACVVLRLRDGRTTTIPVGVLAIDREQFVRELQGHLQRGQGLRPL